MLLVKTTRPSRIMMGGTQFTSKIVTSPTNMIISTNTKIFLRRRSHNTSTMLLLNLLILFLLLLTPFPSTTGGQNKDYASSTANFFSCNNIFVSAMLKHKVSSGQQAAKLYKASSHEQQAAKSFAAKPSTTTTTKVVQATTNHNRNGSTGSTKDTSNKKKLFNELAKSTGPTTLNDLRKSTDKAMRIISPPKQLIVDNAQNLQGHSRVVGQCVQNKNLQEEIINVRNSFKKEGTTATKHKKKLSSSRGVGVTTTTRGSPPVNNNVIQEDGFNTGREKIDKDIPNKQSGVNSNNDLLLKELMMQTVRNNHATNAHGSIDNTSNNKNYILNGGETIVNQKYLDLMKSKQAADLHEEGVLLQPREQHLAQSYKLLNSNRVSDDFEKTVTTQVDRVVSQKDGKKTKKTSYINLFDTAQEAVSANQERQNQLVAVNNRFSAPANFNTIPEYAPTDGKQKSAVTINGNIEQSLHNEKQYMLKDYTTNYVTASKSSSKKAGNMKVNRERATQPRKDASVSPGLVEIIDLPQQKKLEIINRGCPTTQDEHINDMLDKKIVEVIPLLTEDKHILKMPSSQLGAVTTVVTNKQETTNIKNDNHKNSNHDDDTDLLLMKNNERVGRSLKANVKTRPASIRDQAAEHQSLTSGSRTGLSSTNNKQYYATASNIRISHSGSATANSGTGVLNSIAHFRSRTVLNSHRTSRGTLLAPQPISSRLLMKNATSIQNKVRSSVGSLKDNKQSNSRPLNTVVTGSNNKPPKTSSPRNQMGGEKKQEKLVKKKRTNTIPGTTQNAAADKVVTTKTKLLKNSSSQKNLVENSHRRTLSGSDIIIVPKNVGGTSSFKNNYNQDQKSRMTQAILHHPTTNNVSASQRKMTAQTNDQDHFNYKFEPLLTMSGNLQQQYLTGGLSSTDHLLKGAYSSIGGGSGTKDYSSSQQLIKEDNTSSNLTTGGLQQPVSYLDSAERGNFNNNGMASADLRFNENNYGLKNSEQLIVVDKNVDNVRVSTSSGGFALAPLQFNQQQNNKPGIVRSQVSSARLQIMPSSKLMTKQSSKEKLLTAEKQQLKSATRRGSNKKGSDIQPTVLYKKQNLKSTEIGVPSRTKTKRPNTEWKPILTSLQSEFERDERKKQLKTKNNWEQINIDMNEIIDEIKKLDDVLPLTNSDDGIIPYSSDSKLNEQLQRSLDIRKKYEEQQQISSYNLNKVNLAPFASSSIHFNTRNIPDDQQNKAYHELKSLLLSSKDIDRLGTSRSNGIKEDNNIVVEEEEDHNEKHLEDFLNRAKNYIEENQRNIISSTKKRTVPSSLLVPAGSAKQDWGTNQISPCFGGTRNRDSAPPVKCERKKLLKEKYSKNSLIAATQGQGKNTLLNNMIPKAGGQSTVRSGGNIIATKGIGNVHNTKMSSNNLQLLKDSGHKKDMMTLAGRFSTVAQRDKESDSHNKRLSQEDQAMMMSSYKSTLDKDPKDLEDLRNKNLKSLTSSAIILNTKTMFDEEAENNFKKSEAEYDNENFRKVHNNSPELSRERNLRLLENVPSPITASYHGSSILENEKKVHVFYNNGIQHSEKELLNRLMSAQDWANKIKAEHENQELLNHNKNKGSKDRLQKNEIIGHSKKMKDNKLLLKSGSTAHVLPQPKVFTNARCKHTKPDMNNCSPKHHNSTARQESAVNQQASYKMKTAGYNNSNNMVINSNKAPNNNYDNKQPVTNYDVPNIGGVKNSRQSRSSGGNAANGMLTVNAERRETTDNTLPLNFDDFAQEYEVFNIDELEDQDNFPEDHPANMYGSSSLSFGRPEKMQFAQSNQSNQKRATNFRPKK